MKFKNGLILAYEVSREDGLSIHLESMVCFHTTPTQIHGDITLLVKFKTTCGKHKTNNSKTHHQKGTIFFVPWVDVYGIYYIGKNGYRIWWPLPSITHTIIQLEWCRTKPKHSLQNLMKKIKNSKKIMFFFILLYL